VPVFEFTPHSVESKPEPELQGAVPSARAGYSQRMPSHAMPESSIERTTQIVLGIA